MNIVTSWVSTPAMWSAIDIDTYDGAPDAGTANTIGYGKTEGAAVIDLMEKLAENERERHCEDEGDR